MAKTTTDYGSIRYIEHYLDAPDTAEFILRQLSDGSAVLERYNRNKESMVIAEFPFDSYWESEFYQTLKKCRELIGSNKRIWVVEPEWWWRRNRKSK